MDPNFYKLSVLTLHCIVNWQIHREWKGGEGAEGRMKLSNANQPTASIGIVHHVYITCPNARTMFTLMTCQRILPICSNAMNLWVLEQVWVCGGVLMCGESFHAWTCVYVGIMNGSAIICQHTHFYSPFFNYVCYELCVQHYSG